MSEYQLPKTMKISNLYYCTRLQWLRFNAPENNCANIIKNSTNFICACVCLCINLQFVLMFQHRFNYFSKSILSLLHLIPTFIWYIILVNLF